MQIHIPNLV